MRTITKKDGEETDAKSCQGQIAWRTFYNKITKEGKNWLPSKNVKADEVPVEAV